MPENHSYNIDSKDGHDQSAVQWPEGKQFAFTVFDDTDCATVENVSPVYDLLEQNGFRTTKSVWPKHGNHSSEFEGSTCEQQEYLDWVLRLEKLGFEIALHNATYHSSTREETLEGMEKFIAYIGHPPLSHANHYNCADGLYWGKYRFTGMNRFIYSLLTNGAYNNTFEGHIESSPYFWADICNKHIRYVRDFVFPEINTLKVCPSMPYYDSARPYVKAWFASSDGADVGLFAGMISEQNQDRLEREGGACIMYTHFASGFFRDGAIDPRFKNLIERLGRKNGWFVPVHVLLDHIAAVRGVCTIAPRQRMQMERRFLWNRTLHQLMDKLA